MGVSDKGDKMCSVGGRPGPGLRNTGLGERSGNFRELSGNLLGRNRTFPLG